MSSISRRKRQRKEKSRRIPSQEWLDRKDQIRRLYIEQDFTLDEVLDQLGSHDFTPSRRQLVSQLSIWGMRKYNRSDGQNAIRLPQESTNTEMNPPRTDKACLTSTNTVRGILGVAANSTSNEENIFDPANDVDWEKIMQLPNFEEITDVSFELFRVECLCNDFGEPCLHRIERESDTGDAVTMQHRGTKE